MHFKKKHPREAWQKGVPYLNFIARAKYTERHYPRSDWPSNVPYGRFDVLRKQYPLADWPKGVKYLNFKAFNEHNEKHYPRAQWPETVPYLDFKARGEYYEKHYPRAEWPVSIPYLDFKTLDKYEKRYPRDQSSFEGVLYLDWDTLKPYVARVQREMTRQELADLSSYLSLRYDSPPRLPNNKIRQYPMQFAWQPPQAEYGLRQSSAHFQERFNSMPIQRQHAAPSQQHQYTALPYQELPASALLFPGADNGYVYPEPQFQSSNGNYYQYEPIQHGLSQQRFARAVAQYGQIQDVAQQYPAQLLQGLYAAEEYSSPPRPSPQIPTRQSPLRLVHDQSPAMPPDLQHSDLPVTPLLLTHRTKPSPAQPAASQQFSPHTSPLTLVHRAKPACEPLMNEANVNALLHYNAQFDRLAALTEKSRMNLCEVSFREWQDAAAGTDLLETNVEAAQRMEFSRRLEAGEIKMPLSFSEIEKVFGELKRGGVVRGIER